MRRRRFLSLSLAAAARPAITAGADGTRFAVIADIQLFRDHALPILALLKSRPVEFVIVAGDVTCVECEDIDTGWQWTVEQLDGLGKPWCAVPGNHDWGSGWGKPTVVPPQPEALGAWERYVGPAQFVLDLDYTRIIGLDFYDWTPANKVWVSDKINETSKRVVIISHYPLTGVQAKWLGGFDWLDWYSQDKTAFFDAHNVAAFVCGHRHQFGLARAGRMTQILCPPCAPVVIDNEPEAAPDGLLPTTVPTRGWLEFVDGSVLNCEVYRQDGQQIIAFDVATGWALWMPSIAK